MHHYAMHHAMRCILYKSWKYLFLKIELKSMNRFARQTLNIQNNNLDVYYIQTHCL